MLQYSNSFNPNIAAIDTDVTMVHQIIRPPKSLQHHVKYFSLLKHAYNAKTTVNQICVFADRFPQIIFHHCDGQSAFRVNGYSLPTTFFSGIKTVPFICDVNGKHTVITATFYPNAVKELFGINVNEFNNELLDIPELLPGSLNDQLLNTETDDEKIDVLTTFLLKRINHQHDRFPLNEILKKINSPSRESSVFALCNHFNISERQLERQFSDSVGLSPKLYLRIARFEKSLALIRKKNFTKLSDIAHDLNFTDQSHFTKEFKEFSGLTPKAFINQKVIFDFDSPNPDTPQNEVIINHRIIS